VEGGVRTINGAGPMIVWELAPPKTASSHPSAMLEVEDKDSL
jgi:hypothetical protein